MKVIYLCHSIVTVYLENLEQTSITLHELLNIVLLEDINLFEVFVMAIRTSKKTGQDLLTAKAIRKTFSFKNFSCQKRD